MYQFTDKEKNVLKEMAALQFPGSKANISTRTPIHFVLEQCGEYVPSVIDADVDDADSGEFFFSLNHYDSGRGECNLSSNTASGLVLDFLGISENEVSEYNEKAKEKEDVQFVPFERAMHEQKSRDGRKMSMTSKTTSTLMASNWIPSKSPGGQIAGMSETSRSLIKALKLS